jgi:hypothetical protein
VRLAAALLWPAFLLTMLLRGRVERAAQRIVAAPFDHVVGLSLLDLRLFRLRRWHCLLLRTDEQERA